MLLNKMKQILQMMLKKMNGLIGYFVKRRRGCFGKVKFLKKRLHSAVTWRHERITKIIDWLFVTILRCSVILSSSNVNIMRIIFVVQHMKNHRTLMTVEDRVTNGSDNMFVASHVIAECSLFFEILNFTKVCPLSFYKVTNNAFIFFSIICIRATSVCLNAICHLSPIKE